MLHTHSYCFGDCRKILCYLPHQSPFSHFFVMNRNHLEILTSLIQETIQEPHRLCFRNFCTLSVSRSNWLLNKEHSNCRHTSGSECTAPLHSEPGWAGGDNAKDTSRLVLAQQARTAPATPGYCQPGCRGTPGCLLGKLAQQARRCLAVYRMSQTCPAAAAHLHPPKAQR